MGALDGVPDIIQFGTVQVRLVERNLHGFRKDRPITDARRRHADPVREAFPASARGDPTMNGGLKTSLDLDEGPVLYM